MNQRPLPVTLIAWLLIVTGVFGGAMHIRDLVSQRSLHLADLGIPLASLLAAVCGVFLLRGHHWARWFAVAWMAFHVAISLFDSWQKVAVHVVLLALFAYFLFREDAKAYFRAPNLADGH